MTKQLSTESYLWCGTTFIPRRDGGKQQVFCRPACRRAFDGVGRRWVAEAIAGGTLTLDALRNSPPAKRALLPGAILPVPLSEPQKPAPIAPAQRPGVADELLSALLAVPSAEGWHALAAAMSQGLFDRLKRWHAARLTEN
jgi:hypothetical protein